MPTETSVRPLIREARELAVGTTPGPVRAVHVDYPTHEAASVQLAEAIKRGGRSLSFVLAPPDPDGSSVFVCMTGNGPDAARNAAFVARAWILVPELAGALELVLGQATRFFDERDALRAAIREHRAQRADDRCVEDDDRLYEALGDGIKCDRRVGEEERGGRS